MKNNIIEEFDKKFVDDLDGSENNQYIHLVYSDAPFGYRPADKQDITQFILKALAEQKKELIDSWAEYTEEALRKQLKKINKL